MTNLPLIFNNLDESVGTIIFSRDAITNLVNLKRKNKISKSNEKKREQRVGRHANNF